MTTWTRIKEIGSGTVDFRLQVEGWPHEWVTNPRITHATNAAGRTVYAGLSYKGLKISEKCDLKSAWPVLQGMTISIVPTDLAESTMMFTRDPIQVAFLFESITDGDTVWSTKPATLPAGVYHVATEAVRCDGANNIVRAHWNTGAQIHSVIDATVENPVAIYSWPPTMEGRRANLYVYGPGDDAAGDGEIIWRGIVARSPRMERDGVSWTLALDPITKVFEQNVGGDESREYKIRGIYRSNQCPMRMYFRTQANGTNEVTIPPFEGFFDTDQAFIDAVNAALVTSFAAATGNAALLDDLNPPTFWYVNGQPCIAIRFPSDSAGDFEVGVDTTDALEGDFVGNGVGPGDPKRNGKLDKSGRVYAGGSDGAWTFPLATVRDQWGTWTPLPAPWGYPLPIARAMLGALHVNSELPSYYYQNVTTTNPAFPGNRMYLETVDDLVVGSVLAVLNGDADEPDAYLTITFIDTTDRWVEVDIRPTNPATQIYLSDATRLLLVGFFGTNTDWSGFMYEVVTQAVAANLGRVPYITSEDVENNAWSALWATYPFNDYWRNRNYQFIKPAKVRDVLTPEWMATGFMGRINASGKLDVAPLPVVSPQATASFTIDDSEILLPAEGMFGMFPTWESQRDGLVNIVKLRLGYQPFTAEFNEARDFTVRQVNSIAEHKSGNRASAEIGPLSTWTGTEMPPAPVIAEFVQPYLRALSQDYAIVTIAVPFTRFDVLCGDLVEISSAFIPNGLGQRGVTHKNCICVGREWNLDPASNQMGTLTLWFPRDSGKRAGYAPTGRITAQSNSSGNIWVLTLSAANPRNVDWAEPSGFFGFGDVVKHFAIGDPIQIVRVNVDAPTVVTGQITALPAADQITVSLGAAWTPGTNTWNLRFWMPGDADPLRPNVFAHSFYYGWVADDNQALADGTVARSFL